MRISKKGEVLFVKNRFGNLFQLTTFGESHGKAIGVVIDNCPAGIEITEEEIFAFLQKRRPGTFYTSPRKEKDYPQILSGVFDNKTTGAPICILIENIDADSSKYYATKDLYKPGHANYTYLQKYGIFDYRGGGRASGRETACRVAAAAIAKKLLEKEKITIFSHVNQIGSLQAFTFCEKHLQKSEIFCADKVKEKEMISLLSLCKKEGDSIGGIVECRIQNCPIGLGEPVYEKLQANFAKAMLSIPAVKGFEIGDGFSSCLKKGSESNDGFIQTEGSTSFLSNHAGGTLGGISTGQEIVFRVAFKPTSSIRKIQKTVNVDGEEKEYLLPKGSRHDPCIAIRGCVVVEAMAYLVLADAYLLNKIARH